MCEVLPTIMDESEEEGSKLEQLMMSMLEERDKLMESLRESQESYKEATKQLSDVQTDNKILMRQLQALMPEVGVGGGCSILCQYLTAMPISRYWHSSPSELCHMADILLKELAIVSSRGYF